MSGDGCLCVVGAGLGWGVARGHAMSEGVCAGAAHQVMMCCLGKLMEKMSMRVGSSMV